MSKTPARRLIEGLIKRGHTVCIYSVDGVLDYKGTNAAAAYEAVEACDVMSISVIIDKGGEEKRDWATVIHEFGDRGQIADYRLGGPIEQIIEEGGILD